MIRRIVVALVLVIIAIGEVAAQAPPRGARDALLERPQLKSSTETLLVSFPEDVSLQEIFLEIGRRAGVTVLFDESYRDQTTPVNLGRVSVKDALEKLTLVHRLFYKIVDPTTVIIIPDNTQKHRQYDDMLVHTFFVAHGDVNRIANMFRTIAGIQRVQPDLNQKSVTVRATVDELLVAQGILARNDRPPAELAFQVDILAIGRDPKRMLRVALTADEYVRFKPENDAEVLLSQIIRLTDNESARMAFEEGALRPVTEPTPADKPVRADEEQGPKTPVPPRAVGLQLSLHPQVSLDGDIHLSVALQATVPIENQTIPGSAPSAVRTREVTTTVSMKDGETTLLPVMFRVEDFGAALSEGRGPSAPREVVVAVGASVLRASARPDVLPPLPIGTEQRIRVPQP